MVGARLHIIYVSACRMELVVLKGRGKHAKHRTTLTLFQFPSSSSIELHKPLFIISTSQLKTQSTRNACTNTCNMVGLCQHVTNRRVGPTYTTVPAIPVNTFLSKCVEALFLCRFDLKDVGLTSMRESSLCVAFASCWKLFTIYCHCKLLCSS